MVIRSPSGVFFLPKTQIDQGNQYRPNISELKGINFLSQASPIAYLFHLAGRYNIRVLEKQSIDQSSKKIQFDQNYFPHFTLKHSS